MKRNPLYVFKGLDSIGINDVPLNTTFQLNDIELDPNIEQEPRIMYLVDKTGFFSGMTIGQMLQNFPDSFIDLTTATEIPSELEKFKINNGIDTAWRILGRDESQYGPAGIGSFDFSNSSNILSGVSPYGASGDYSFCTGYRAQAKGRYSITQGYNTIAEMDYSYAGGLWNIGNPDNIFEIGVGSGESNRRNAFEITSTGIIKAPEMTIAEIDQTGATALVTKEYNDANIDSKYEKIGGIISGDVTIEGTQPTYIPSLINKGLAQFEQIAKFEQSAIMGLDSSLNSRIKFEDNTLAEPEITWHTSLRDFYVNTADQALNQLWHGGNHGTGSGLDADLLQGIPGNQYATLQYTDNGLDNKYDKLGGIISGDVSIFGDLTTSGLATLRRLEVELDSIFIGAAQFNSNINMDGDLTTTARAYINTIDSDIEFTGTTTFNSLNVFKDDLIINPEVKLVIKPSADRRSKLYFEDFSSPNPAPNLLPTFFWNSDQNDFYVKGNNLDTYRIWHEGNLPAANMVYSFDDLNDTPSSKIAGQFVRVNPTASGLEYYDLILTDENAIWGNISGSITNQGDLYGELQSKYNSAGGSITGNVTINGNIIIMDNLPTVDPGQPGQLWDNNGVLSISQ